VQDGHWTERGSWDTIEDVTPVVMCGTTGLVVSQMTRGTTDSVACGVMCEIAGRVDRHIAVAATCPVPDRMPCETTDQGLRTVTAETALQTMYDTTLPTKDQTTVQTTSQTIR